MTGAVQTCQTPPPNETRCEQLAREIDELINRDKDQCGGGGTHGLRHRFREQVAAGAQGPGTKAWATHDQAIRNQQSGLRNRLNEYDTRGCDDQGRGPGLPADARSWATRPRPTASQWKHNNPQNAAPAPSDDMLKKMSEITGLTGAALVIYLIISEGSRLFPPRNLVPVP
jgi:hypothetical protein